MEYLENLWSLFVDMSFYILIMRSIFKRFIKKNKKCCKINN